MKLVTNVEADLHYLEIMDNELDPEVSEIFETTYSTDLSVLGSYIYTICRLSHIPLYWYTSIHSYILL